MMLNRILFFISLYFIPTELFASNSMQGMFVIGVVGMNKPSAAVVLIKNSQGRILPAKVGQKLSQSFGGWNISSVSNKYVYFSQSDRSLKIKIGTGDVESVSIEPNLSIQNSLVAGGIEKKGNEVNIAKDLKEHLINERLEAVLMQAAAVPHIVGGRLKGFEVWEIEEGSLFNALGLQNGDVVTAIDGREISSASLAIKQLNSLRNATALSFSFVRNGKSQDVSVRIQ